MPDTGDASVGILGGGMLGLTLALRLAARGEAVTVLDAAPEPGGLASAWTVGGVRWDRFYHVVSRSDTALLALIDEIGLGARLRFETTRTNFFDGDGLWPLDNALDYLRLPALGMNDKLRVAWTILRAARVRDLRTLESSSAEQWLTALGGRGAWLRLWRPLLRSKLGRNIDHASAAYLCSVIQRFYGARQGGARREMFGYVEGGYDCILERLVARLHDLGVRLVGSAPVEAVARREGALEVTTAAGRFRFARAVATFAAPLAARACRGLEPDEVRALEAIRYQGIVCASVLLARPLGGAYMTYITDESMPFTTVIEMSSLVDPGAFGGRHLVYLPQYVPADDPLLDEDDAAIERRCLEGLRRMFPDLASDEVLAVRIARARHVMALPGLDYSRRLPHMRTSVPGLWIASSAHIVNASLSVNESVTLADRVAQSLASAGGEAA